jgi:hypothetical protein
MLTWSRPMDDNEWEYGCLKFNQYRLLAHGNVCRVGKSHYTRSSAVKESFDLTKGTKIKVKLPRQSDIIDECRLCRTKMYVYMEFLFIINKKVNCPTMGLIMNGSTDV